MNRVGATVRIDHAKLVQPLTHDCAQRRVADEASRRILMQTQAAQRGRVGSRCGVIPGCPTATLDRDPSFGAQPVQDAPERLCRLCRPSLATISARRLSRAFISPAPMTAPTTASLD